MLGIHRCRGSFAVRGAGGRAGWRAFARTVVHDHDQRVTTTVLFRGD
jgi:hypothetical protein